MSSDSSDSTFPIVCLFIAVVCAVLWIFGKLYLRQQQLKVQEMVAAASQVQAGFSDRARAFVNENMQEWPHRLAASAVATRSYIMINQARSELRFLELVNTDRMVLVDYVVPLAAVVSVELQQNSETVMRVETSAAINKRGSAGRAALGALVAGPAGAVVGAASRRTTAAANSVSTTYTQAGPIFLVIGTGDFERPVIKLEVSSLAVGEEWLHRIRGAMLLASTPGEQS